MRNQPYAQLVKGTENGMKKYGYTLVQLMVGISIISILLTAGIPSFAEFQRRQELRQILLQTKQLISEARHIAIVHRKNITVVVDTGDRWCIGATTDLTCDCQQITGCQINDIAFTLTAKNNDVVLSESRNRVGTKIVFTASYGTAYGFATTLRLNSVMGVGKVIINNLGRVRMCTDTASALGMQQC
ncbi:hypothetical protein OPS25_02500 [Alteromonas ponticola]|uniref:Prepilin-type N-terminal cleavage/methylation domain-containing protein n=1 Tax=Alteromonas aquimaris TaxID=2998417 RepID=A0ABT3P5L0_9ALTE|nr:GspH/FimT family pseudopilin [Alteromonas aquimaris]MCW8107371.1 hypothetical protein [Alteromonas aquimaris]